MLKIIKRIFVIVLLFISLFLLTLSVNNKPALADDIHAKAIYVYDLKAGTVLISKNPEAQVPIASITKIATAYAALRMLGRDRGILISPETLATEGDSGLIAGETWNIVDLIKFMLIVSSNDAARALEQAVNNNGGLIVQMNGLASELGLEQTFFLNTSGLDLSASLAGAYSSARDVSILLAQFNKEYPDIMISTIYPQKDFHISNILHTALNTNLYTTRMVGLLGSKTGSTELAGANLSIIFDSEIGRPIVATALGSDGEYRFPDIITLINEILHKLSKGK